MWKHQAGGQGVEPADPHWCHQRKCPMTTRAVATPRKQKRGSHVVNAGGAKAHALHAHCFSDANGWKTAGSLPLVLSVLPESVLTHGLVISFPFHLLSCVCSVIVVTPVERSCTRTCSCVEISRSDVLRGPEWWIPLLSGLLPVLESPSSKSRTNSHRKWIRIG